MKRFLKLLPCLLLAVVLACVALQPTEANAASVEDLTFKLNIDGTSYTVTDCNESASGELTIPATYYGYRVTAIGDEAFCDCDELASITIPSSIVSIGEDAFDYCYDLTNVNITDIKAWCNIDFYNASSNPFCYAWNLYLNKTLVTDLVIPKGVTAIKDYAFYSCDSLNSVSIPNSVTAIGTDAFRNCNIASVTIGSGVATIGQSAFENCDGLTDITIPNSVTSIARGAFYHCDYLTGVTIGKGVTAIGQEAFCYCDALSKVFITDVAAWCHIDFYDATSNPLHNARKLYLNDKLVTDLVIPSGTTAIGQYAFYNCDSFGSLTISDSVTAIGREAFKDCDGLTDLMIPDSVTNIDNGAFCCCDSLSAVDIGDGVTVIKPNTFSSCGTLSVVVIGDGVTEITQQGGFLDLYSYAFADCGALTTVVIPQSLTYIGRDAFQGCDNITNVYFVGTEEQLNKINYRQHGKLTDAIWILVQDYTHMNAPYTVTSWTANVWTRPWSGGTSTLVNTVPKDTNFQIVAKVTNTSGGVWCQHSGGGWIYAPNLKMLLFNPATVEDYNRSATVINTSGVNIWSKPYSNADSKLIRSATYNSKLNVVAKVVNTSGGLWYKLSDGNWVYSTNIRVTDYNPADAETINKTFVVTSWGANIWSHPYSSGNSQILYSVEKTAALKAVAQVRNSTGGLWYQLTDGNWVYSKNVNERIFDPADVIAYKRSATVIVPGVINIWGQPSTKAPSTVTRTAAYTTKLNVVAKYTTPSGGLWYQLTDGNWVYSANIRITDYNPADVQAISKTVTVTSWGANVWSKPYSSGDSKVVKTVAKAANLKIDGQVRNSTYGLWYHLADGSGWIYSQNVKVK